MRFIVAFATFLILASCVQKSESPDSDLFLPSRRLAELTDKRLSEVSGLAVSNANPGMFWTHNDSGNPAVVYLIDDKLKVRMACRLQGVKNRDWEDIAVGAGPDPDKRYVYIADIGDNDARYALKYIYRFEEPEMEGEGREKVITSFDTIAFRLEDGRKDTETILVHPRSGNIYIVSKRERPVHVYEVASGLSKDTLTAKKFASLPLTQIVAGDFSPDGSELLLKNYDNIYYWNFTGDDLREGLKSEPVVLKYAGEPQGEAIAFNADGSGFYTLSEKVRGEKTYLYFYERKK